MVSVPAFCDGDSASFSAVVTCANITDPPRTAIPERKAGIVDARIFSVVSAILSAYLMLIAYILDWDYIEYS